MMPVTITIQIDVSMKVLEAAREVGAGAREPPKFRIGIGASA